MLGVVCILIMGIYLFSACAKNTSTTATKFAIYFVKEESKKDALSYGRDINDKYIRANASIDSLSIEDTPILTEKDIKKYDWNTHEIKFTDEYFKNHKPQLKEKDLLAQTGSNQLCAKEFDAVLIMANGKRIYCAGFPISPMKSCFPPEFMISDLSKNSITITKNSNKMEQDLRENKIIYKTLKEAGVLSE
ncbi:hypothetical protein LGL55_18360 [Clostridium tagluense]|nr:hypothetical protein [Clostridium tagluense]MCB2322816.1 hypothetical protein [Clostridium tagluense]MCB2337469.1 hypothetical protein [Clostridium tagluense]MCB2366165.1 hypothetical protein [Clostridium tagluense]